MFNHRLITTLLGILVGICFVSPASADGASAEMLSDTCLGCHGPAGISQGPATPTISGMSELYIIGAMLAYKYDNDEDKVDEIIEADIELEDVEYFARTSTVMNRIAKGYSESEIKMMAKHFANLPFESANQNVDEAQAKSGAALHETHCEKCHENGGSSAEDDAGVLAGQWVPYLEYTMADYASGDREMPKKMKKQMEEAHAASGDEAMRDLIQFYANQK
ncbi:MAG: cytochrome c [Gammaproteobacteria bacterium]